VLAWTVLTCNIFINSQRYQVNGPATWRGPILYKSDRIGVTGLLGIDDPQIIIGYALALGLGLICLIYGIRNWNKGGDADG
jgi:hypothetical protein